jgi:hypothetical protein
MRALHLRNRSILFALMVAALATPAASQDDPGGVLDMTGMGIYAMEETVMQAARESVARPRNRARIAPAPAARLTYKPSMERRRANFATFVAKSRKKDPVGAAMLEKELATSDVMGKMERALAGFGMHVDNVADAYAIWWLNAWLASRQRADTPPAAQIAAVRAQAAQAIASTPGFATASDAVKQEMAEANLLQAMLIGAYIDRAEGDRDLSRRLAAAVREGARASGLNLDTMELTNEGFVPRRTGAVEDKAVERSAAKPRAERG